jgi:putative ABC transport system ATP-binding protein
MDEPFSNLDETNRKKAMELIGEEVNARNATLILFDLKDNEYFKPDRILYL